MNVVFVMAQELLNHFVIVNIIHGDVITNVLVAQIMLTNAVSVMDKVFQMDFVLVIDK